MRFKENFVYYLFESVYYRQEFSEAMLHLTKKCKKLKHIVFIDEDYDYIKKGKVTANAILKKLTTMDGDTMKCG